MNLEEVKGIGPKTIEILNKLDKKELCINIETGEIINNPLIEKINKKFGDLFAVELVK